jgi:hypothetical protein
VGGNGGNDLYFGFQATFIFIQMMQEQSASPCGSENQFSNA